MKTYIPTIEALRGKTKGELNAAFKRAVETANSTAASAQTRAAQQTLQNIRICLTVKFGP